MNSTFYCLYLLLISVGNLGNLVNSIDKQELEFEKILNSSINPCTNFYKFSCKDWISTAEKPSYEILWNHWHASANIINAKLRRILERNSSEMQSFKKAQSMYFACLNATREDRTDELALLINGMGGWFLPKIHCKVASQYRWPMKVAQITKFANIHPLLKMHVEVDFENGSRHILYVDSGDLVMPAYILEHPESHIQELLQYKEWIIGTAKLMYSTEKISLNLNEDVDDIITFEIQLAKLASADNKRKLVTIAELIEKTNSIDWFHVFKTLFDDAGVELAGNNPIAVSWPFIEKLTELLKITKPTIICKLN
ncbi:Peptidase [Oryctes borbonicus]|uniref:Peptidase n=1 Tax=Oryctes borbonicus TaxID=1629725 RepID=A0A0T6B376_9SCAR|nr:Peptidase [Oryctes borbonicus]